MCVCMWPASARSGVQSDSPLCLPRRAPRSSLHCRRRFRASSACVNSFEFPLMIYIAALLDSISMLTPLHRISTLSCQSFYIRFAALVHFSITVSSCILMFFFSVVTSGPPSPLSASPPFATAPSIPHAFCPNLFLLLLLTSPKAAQTHHARS